MTNNNMSIPKDMGSIDCKGILPEWLEDELIYCVNNWDITTDSNYKIEPGMTKTTIIYPNYQYVFKIAHKGVYVPKCKEFDGEVKEYIFKQLKHNSCEEEIRHRFAMPVDISDFFLKVNKINNDIYFQEKVKIVPENMEYKIKSYYDKELNFEICTYWLDLAYKKNPKSKVDDLIDYLNEHSEISQDLDNSNLGITKKGLPVIVDYSGFYSYRNF